MKNCCPWIFRRLYTRKTWELPLVTIHELKVGNPPKGQMEHRYIHKNGRTVWTSWSVSAAGDLAQDDANLILQIQDITDRKLAEEKLQYEATHDSLTGLPNRALFMRKLSEAIVRSQQNRKYQISVLFIDLDRFKFVNDSLGHIIGDRLLVEISSRLRECMRPPDIVARFGGDEFVILVEGRYFREKVSSIVERVQSKFEASFDLNGHEVYSSASIGILHASEHHYTAEDMMRDADTAMYQAKKAGKARHQVFDETMHKTVSETLRLETDLRKAVSNGEFSLVYQPIFSLEDSSIQSFETLIRWTHPELGEISPDRFIPLAGEIGMLDDVCEFVLTTACTETKGLLESSNPLSSTKLSVNISSQHFSHRNFVNRVAETLKDRKFPADRLKFEITESVFFEYQQYGLGMLQELREMGIEIEIDDFGKGYSSLSYLAKMPISALKIDRSLTSIVDLDPANTEIIKAVISLAKNLGIRTVGEGIETPSQFAALKRLGCESGQGFLLAEPMSIDLLTIFVEQPDRNTDHNRRANDISVLSTVQ